MKCAWKSPLVLASGSPRRLELLAEAGVDAIPCPPTIDDGIYTCGSMDAKVWVQSLAVLKAQHVLQMQSACSGTILAADTVCIVDGGIFGQPKDEQEAKKMIMQVVQRSHEVYTGWCLLSIEDARLFCACEAATITIGRITEKEIDVYIASGNWRGKAGAYNLSERVSAGWPIICEGDPTSVMGLPMERLQKEIHFGRNEQ
ncbi:MAG: Maf family nucleotide pyrophosphatase [Phycisphaerales bacterium]|mgnify:CR=1 FL=1